MSINNSNMKLYLDKYSKIINEKIKKAYDENIAERIWKKDHTVWSSNPDEISNRLGWLNSPEVTLESLDEIKNFVQSVQADNIKHVLLMGMGGSSLAPEVFSLSFGSAAGYPELHVLDSTHPGAVKNFDDKLNPSETLYIVSTKSGGTVETLSFMKYFYNKAAKKLGEKNASKHFVAITDPGSGLEKIAKELKFRKIFLNDPDIGGRYSALSFFGAVPAALIGIDLKKLLNSAENLVNECRQKVNNPGIELGIAMGELARQGRDKITFILSSKISSFGSWAEQLIAESTGKNGKGILPIDGEELIDVGNYSGDRIFVLLKLNGNENEAKLMKFSNSGHPVIVISLNDVYEMGAEFFRWEFATAVAGWSLGIQPFDQPNVESAKVVARAMMKEYQERGKLPELKSTLDSKGIKIFCNFKIDSLEDVFSKFLSESKSGQNYVAIQAYLKPDEKTWQQLQILRLQILQKYNLATTLGYGPRFLHSTGQLHKGDGGNGYFIQFIADIKNDVPIPDDAVKGGSSISFGTLIRAQALGDRQALADNNRKILTIDLGNSVNESLSKLKA